MCWDQSRTIAPFSKRKQFQSSGSESDDNGEALAADVLTLRLLTEACAFFIRMACLPTPVLL
jgi:hypothetical protein